MVYTRRNSIAAGFKVFIDLSGGHFVPHILADHLTATEPLLQCRRTKFR